MASVDNSLYGLHCHCPGLNPTTQTMRGPNWSIPQCINEFLQYLPMATQALWIQKCSLASWSDIVPRPGQGCAADRPRMSHYPSISAADITDCATQSHLTPHTPPPCWHQFTATLPHPWWHCGYSQHSPCLAETVAIPHTPPTLLASAYCHTLLHPVSNFL